MIVDALTQDGLSDYQGDSFTTHTPQEGFLHPRPTALPNRTRMQVFKLKVLFQSLGIFVLSLCLKMAIL